MTPDRFDPPPEGTFQSEWGIYSEPVSKAQVRKRTRKQARAQGCRCDVEIDATRVGENGWQLSVRHDDWCPFLLSRHASGN